MKRKVVINQCYGGFGLSPLAEKMYYKKKNPGKTIYFYKKSFEDDYTTTIYTRLDVENPGNDIDVCTLCEDLGPEFKITKEDRDNDTEFYKKFSDAFVWNDEYTRHDPDLIEIVETLGPDADGKCADLKVIDIGEKLYRIEEYDGYESLITPGDDVWL